MLQEQAQWRTAWFQVELRPELAAKWGWGMSLSPLSLSHLLCDTRARGEAAPACPPGLCEYKR